MPRRITRTRLLLGLLVIGVLATACSSSSEAVSDAAIDASSAPTTSTETPVDTADAIGDAAAIGSVSEEETEEDEAIEPSGRDFSEVTTTVDSLVAELDLEGAGLIVVDKNDGVIYEEYFGAFDAERVSLIASASKMISAGVLLRLEEEGLLDMDAPIEGNVDWAVGNPEITPAQLVSNSSGLVGLGPNFLYSPYVCQWGVPNTLQECGETVFNTADDDDDQIPPDSEFRYGGAQWQVAGAVAEAVSGASWDQLINDIYVEPCDVASLGYISLGAVLDGTPGYPKSFAGDPSGVTPSPNPSIEGGAHITAGDYAKLLLMHLRGGSCGDNAILSQASLDTMHADRISDAYGGDSGVNSGYGMGWWVDRETGRISDGGAWGAIPWLDLDDGYGAYLVIENQSATGNAIKDQIEELIHTAVTGK